MLSWFLLYAIQGAFVFLISLAYEDAVLRGIRSARDEQHRLTPLSPWLFFMRGFGPRAVRVGLAAIPWLLCGAYLAQDVWAFSIYDYEVWIRFISTDLFLYMLRSEMPEYAGLTLGSCALIMLLAPRIGNIGIGALLGTVIVTPINICLAELWPQHRSVSGTWDVLGVGLAAFAFAWLYVRFKLDRAWFRFDD